MVTRQPEAHVAMMWPRVWPAGAMVVGMEYVPSGMYGPSGQRKEAQGLAI